LLTHTTESPALTVSIAGWKLVPSIVTVCVAGFGASAAAPGLLPHESRPSAATTSGRMEYVTLVFTVAQSALLQRRLEFLGMLEVRDEGRPHFHQQRLQLCIPSAGDQGLVDRVDHRLVIRDLVVAAP